MSTPTLHLITAGDDPSEVLAAAEDAVRAGIVHDYWTAIDKGDRLGAWTARYLAEQIDASTPHGPRLVDELAHGPIAA